MCVYGGGGGGGAFFFFICIFFLSLLSSNRDFEKVKDWAKQWLVNFSIEKTKLMTCSFRSINHTDIVLDGMALPETSNHKHLGLTFNVDL